MAKEKRKVAKEGRWPRKEGSQGKKVIKKEGRKKGRKEERKKEGR